MCSHASDVCQALANIVAMTALQAIECKSCGDQTNVWICTACFHVGCSRYIKDHALNHFKETNHSVSISPADASVFCYDCDKDLTLYEQKIVELQKAIVVNHVNRIQVVIIESGSDISEEKAKNTKQNLDANDNPVEVFLTRTCGLRNLGNTCYMNAVLQCLANLSIFAQYIAQVAVDPTCSNESRTSSGRSTRSSRHATQVPVIAESLSSLFRAMNSEKLSHSHSPDSFRNAFAKLHDSFWGFRQQDAHEFLRILLSQLESEFPVYQPQLTDVISKCFGGKLQSLVVCIQCGSEYEKVDYFYDLSVDIPQEFWSKPKDQSCMEVCSIQDCLSKFFTLESLTENEWFFCEGCKLKQPSAKQFMILKEPEILCLHIKRFRHDKTTRSKLNSFIQFPLKGLDLSQYLVENDNVETSPCKKMKKTALYNLKSLILHHGSNLSSGHYTSFVNISQKAVPNQISQSVQETEKWFHFNDSTVTEASVDSVKKSSAYILFYCKS